MSKFSNSKLKLKSWRSKPRIIDKLVPWISKVTSRSVKKI